MKRRLVAVLLAVLVVSVLAAPAARAADGPGGSDPPAGTPTQSGSSDGLRVKAEHGLNGGGGHGLAIKDDGTLWAWGYNAYGQLGIDQASVLLPMQVPGIADVDSAAGGEFHTLAVTSGEVWAWGDNDDGQLGQDRSGGTTSTGDEGPRAR